MQPSRNDTLSMARGAMRLGVDAVAGVVGIVERMHGTIQRTPWPVGGASATGARGIAGLVYRIIRASTHLVGRGLDASLALLPPLPEGEESAGRIAVLAALNGVCGDYLRRSGNPLALDMSLHGGGKRIDMADLAGSLQAATGRPPSGRLLLMAHGLCMNDLQWNRNGRDHGAVLAAETGRTVLYLRYNSGLHIADNGRQLAELLQQLVVRWPAPLVEVSIIGHSMGGLVARSACLFAKENGHAWLDRLRKLVFLGSPHLGAPLERGGHWLENLLGLSPYSAPLARLGDARSAGIRDLRRGAITLGEDRLVPLPDGVRCYAIAGTLGKRDGVVAERLFGDGLVPLNSALGRAGDGSQMFDFPPSHQWIADETGHLDLLCRAEVSDRLRIWFGDAGPNDVGGAVSMRGRGAAPASQG